jgi:tripartite-type tricarboxylate transporter receptor subunit TctC
MAAVATLRLLAVTGERRFKQAPDVPTLKELGYNAVVATGREPL